MLQGRARRERCEVSDIEASAQVEVFKVRRGAQEPVHANVVVVRIFFQHQAGVAGIEDVLEGLGGCAKVGGDGVVFLADELLKDQRQDLQGE